MAQQTRAVNAAVRKRKRARASALIAVICAVATAAGCSSGKSADPKHAPSPTGASKKPSKKPADPTEAAKAKAIATYTSYWREMGRSYAKGGAEETTLKDYAAGSALVAANTGMANMREAGQGTVGEVTVKNPTVTQIDLDRKVPNVRLSSCLDVSRWEVIDRDTKKPVVLPSDRLTRYVVVSVVERWPEGWRVVRDTPQEKSC
ncbi:hypothetical protein ACFWH1_28280 [Streptomyces sp. NPDC127037]|uniref:hypothetical protein n=1 Tax=Streptomyces sp. NPDC127037 TaxID=3347113 RepID=UPI003647A93C